MRRLTLAAILVSLSIHSTAWASDSLVIHEASRPDAQGSPANVVGSTIHSTTWLSLEAHYLRRLKLPWPARPILIGAGLDLPLFLWGSSGDLDTIRLSVRGTAEVYRIRWFSLVVDLQSRLGVQDSVLNTSVGWDFQITLAPSFAFESWSISPFVAVRQGIATYVKHGEIVHDAFDDRYPDGQTGVAGPKDGWIAGGNTRIPFGLAVGVDLSSQFALYGSAGLTWTRSPLGVGMFDAMMLGHWPFFVDLGVRWRF